MKKIAFQTLGCKLNFSETSTLSRQFGSEGFQQVDFNEPADIYVINSCSVTQNAEKRCREMIKKAMKKNPEAHIAIIGCFSQLNPDEIRAIPGVDIVLGNADKFNLFEHIKNLEREGAAGRQDVAVEEPDTFVPGFSIDDRTRSFFKIQDGCDYFCAYCTIPLARGRSRSNNIATTIATATEIARTNIKEVVLSGVNIGDFGKDHGENFYGFLQELIKVDGLERVRISSIEPDLLSDEIIHLVAEQKVLMPHFHIPLQSGNDEVLSAMGRRYDTALFAARVENIRKHIPHACIAIDLIVGFPAETDELFQQSYDFVRKMDVSYVHVFTYSERSNTRAVTYQSQVPLKIRQQRSKIMQQLSAHKKDVFYRNNQGHSSIVLWEKDKVKGYMFGFTENYIKVKTPFSPHKVNTLENIVLNHLDTDGVYIVG
ncbi:MAG: tRNA (N(6)-L-threonylcarbamoyladenosine(37)-C(2))-methylthiotransferase MtaB [Bacteroidota bacterium]